jgi:HlyD family secretion protein
MRGLTSGDVRPNLFRPEALAHLAAGDPLDDLMTLPRPRGWLPLLCLGGLVGGILVWAFLGRIPVPASGQGVLVRPGRIVSFQATSSGQLVALAVREGDRVEKGMVVGRLDQASLRQQLDLERARLTRLRSEFAGIAALRLQRTDLEKAILRIRREDAAARLKDMEELAERLARSGPRAVEQQRADTTRALELARKIKSIQESRGEILRKLGAGQAATKEDMLQFQLVYLQTLRQEVELQGQLQEISLRADQLHDTLLEKKDKISLLKTQLNEQAIQEKKLDQEMLELTSAHRLALEDVERTIARLELEVDKQDKVRSEHSGRVVEITAAVGQVMTPGTKIGVIAEEDESSPLTCLAYFTVKEGKQIRPGMPVRVSPDPLQRERYGSIRGSVKSVTPFPVSRESAARLIGNSEVAGALTGDGRHIEVVIELERDPAHPTGFAWTSASGPGLALSAGTTSRVQVTVESRSPVSFVVPLFRDWTGF